MRLKGQEIETEKGANMKNIFNHNKHTSTQANKCTKFSVILKSAVVISILKNLSKHTSLPAYQRTSIFSQLSTINQKLLTFCFVLLFITVMFFQSGCSLTADRYIERSLGHNSICWEDNDHILIYASIAQYWYSQSIVGGESKEYDWTGGEIWRITASTGAKELLFRSKDSKYNNLNAEEMRLVFRNSIYVGNGTNTYRVKDDYSDWDSISGVSVQSIDETETSLVGVYELGGKSVVKYNLISNTEEVLYVNDYMITWLDYDYARNYLLINSNKFVDLNTGEEVVLVEYGDRIEQYIVTGDAINGEIMENYIAMDMALRDTITDIRYVGKLKVNIEDNTIKALNEKAYGFISSDGLKYASGYPHSVLITDTLGEWISNVEFEGDEL